MADLKSVKDAKKKDYSILQKLEMWLWGDGAIYRASTKRRGKITGRVKGTVRDVVDYEVEVAKASKNYVTDLWPYLKNLPGGSQRDLDAVLDFALSDRRNIRREDPNKIFKPSCPPPPLPIC